MIRVMSQSFSYFDAAANRNVLGQLAASVREGGRIILDLWNQEFSPPIRVSVSSRPPAEWLERANVLMAIDSSYTWDTQTAARNNSNGSCSCRRK